MNRLLSAGILGLSVTVGIASTAQAGIIFSQNFEAGLGAQETTSRISRSTAAMRPTTAP
jgi:TolA-binding protein